MLATILPEHRQLFFDNGYIEFEKLFSLDRIRTLEIALEKEICKKLDYPEKFAHHIPAVEQYKEGYDLWRNNDTVRTMTRNKLIGNIMLDLLKERELFLAYDMIINNCAPQSNETVSLQDISSIDGMAGAAIICIREDRGDLPTPNWLPKKIGDVTFIKDDYELEENLQHDGRYFLLGYARKPLIYHYNEKNAHNHALQKMGYDFGDVLSEATHPRIKL